MAVVARVKSSKGFCGAVEESPLLEAITMQQLVKTAD
jgi:hypothetical protein